MFHKVLKLDKETLSKDLDGKVYIVTGANSGVGLETAKQLVRQGGHVVMACRNVDAAVEAARGFSGKGSHEALRLDLADLASVKGFAEAFLAKHKRLDGLDCNAGMVVMSRGQQLTKDGLEATMGVNYFGHFLLTELLLDILKASAPARIVMLSSVVHAGSSGSRPDVSRDAEDYLKPERRSGQGNFAVYSEAKLAAVLYAMELAKRLEGAGVSAFSVHPGWARSNFGSGGPLGIRIAFGVLRPLTRMVSNSNADSAQTPLHCLVSEDAPAHSGAYFSQGSVLYRDPGCRNGGWPMKSPNPNVNMKAAEEFTALSRAVLKSKGYNLPS